MAEPYSIKLPVFEGPFDLLLHLIRENKIDIYDIPIVLITSQYLEYIKMMKELNLDIAGEFLVMASTLIHIKSRMLLPVEETLGTEELEDPRFELVQRLIEYQAFKDAALGFREREQEWKGIGTRNPEEQPEGTTDEGPELYLFDLNFFDLIAAFKKILERVPPETIIISREVLTVKDRMSMIIEKIEGKDTIRFEDLFEQAVTKMQLIVTFVALLELLRLGVARIYQEKAFGEIWVINPQAKSSEPLQESETPQEPEAPLINESEQQQEPQHEHGQETEQEHQESPLMNEQEQQHEPQHEHGQETEQEHQESPLINEQGQEQEPEQEHELKQEPEPEHESDHEHESEQPQDFETEQEPEPEAEQVLEPEPEQIPEPEA